MFLFEFKITKFGLLFVLLVKVVVVVVVVFVTLSKTSNSPSATKNNAFPFSPCVTTATFSSTGSFHITEINSRKVSSFASANNTDFRKDLKRNAISSSECSNLRSLNDTDDRVIIDVV